MHSYKKPSFRRNDGKTWKKNDKEDNKLIQEWCNERLNVSKGQRRYRSFFFSSLNLDTLKSFMQHFNLTVIVHVILSLVAVYIFQIAGISFDIPAALFVSPVVFPLAFSINSDYQRREKILDDLAAFQSSGMTWFFCMREWREASGLDMEWLISVHCSLKSLLFHLREYLLNPKLQRRKVILRAIYKNFSDSSQYIETLRASKLPGNPAIVSRAINQLYMMCLAFERLRVIREYRSPRSIRAFNKIFIMTLPVLLAPYFVFIGINNKSRLAPYYIAAPAAFVFSALQTAHDKLFDPFNGTGEDDINIDRIDEIAIGYFDNPKQPNQPTPFRDSNNLVNDKKKMFDDVMNDFQTSLSQGKENEEYMFEHIYDNGSANTFYCDRIDTTTKKEDFTGLNTVIDTNIGNHPSQSNDGSISSGYADTIHRSSTQYEIISLLEESNILSHTQSQNNVTSIDFAGEDFSNHERTNNSHGKCNDLNTNIILDLPLKHSDRPNMAIYSEEGPGICAKTTVPGVAYFIKFDKDRI